MATDTDIQAIRDRLQAAVLLTEHHRFLVFIQNASSSSWYILFHHRIPFVTVPILYAPLAPLSVHLSIIQLLYHRTAQKGTDSDYMLDWCCIFVLFWSLTWCKPNVVCLSAPLYSRGLYRNLSVRAGLQTPVRLCAHLLAIYFLFLYSSTFVSDAGIRPALARDSDGQRNTVGFIHACHGTGGAFFIRRIILLLNIEGAIQIR
jgi:hypothetical protein